jgi:hypothetical protein
MSPIRITIEVVAFLVSGGWFDRLTIKRRVNGLNGFILIPPLAGERIKRICRAQILTLQLKKREYSQEHGADLHLLRPLSL